MLQLGSTGLTSKEISLRTGIPRRTIHGWRAGAVPSRYLTDGSGCERCGNHSHDFSQLPAGYAYLLGLYLGDGSIATHPRGVYKLRVTLDARYPKIVDECARAMREVRPQSRVNRWARPYGDIEVYSYSKAWSCLFPQHGPGPKHLRPIELTDWQEVFLREYPGLLIRGLIHSDGCRFMNTGRKWSHPRYSFKNLSPDIRNIYCRACEELNLRWTISGRVIYVSRKHDVARLDELVGPKR